MRAEYSTPVDERLNPLFVDTNPGYVVFPLYGLQLLSEYLRGNVKQYILPDNGVGVRSFVGDDTYTEISVGTVSDRQDGFVTIDNADIYDSIKISIIGDENIVVGIRHNADSAFNTWSDVEEYNITANTYRFIVLEKPLDVRYNIRVRRSTSGTVNLLVKIIGIMK